MTIPPARPSDPTIRCVDLPRLHAPDRERLVKAVVRILDDGEFILGSAVEELERWVAALHELPFAIGVNSGTDALILALLALDVGPGDEVVTVPNSFVATVAAIAHVGARAVLVDVGDDFNMDPAALAAALTPRTRAIVPVHLYGRPARMDRIMAVADAAHIPVVEDASQALGAELRGRKVGTWGVCGCFSLHPIKNLGAAGDAGIVVTADPGLARRIRLLRNHGLLDRDTCLRWGLNSRLDAVQAAILLVKLERLSSYIERRRALAALYQRLLRDLPLQLPLERTSERSIWQAFVIRTPQRDALRDALRAHGIETLVHYPTPIHLQPAAAGLGYGPGSFPTCEQQAREILSLPLHPALSDDEARQVAARVQGFFRYDGRR